MFPEINFAESISMERLVFEWSNNGSPLKSKVHWCYKHSLSNRFDTNFSMTTCTLAIPNITWLLLTVICIPHTHTLHTTHHTLHTTQHTHISNTYPIILSTGFKGSLLLVWNVKRSQYFLVKFFLSKDGKTKTILTGQSIID